MSVNVGERILDLLRQHQYPGADRFSERDIEILTRNPTVKAAFTKFASLQPNQFLSKDQVDVLRLAGELNDPEFIPLDPVEIRKQILELRKTEREQKRQRMQERHRREEIAQLKKVIGLLEQDEALRDCVRRKREQMTEVLEVQIRKVEKSLKAAQQDLQTASSMFRVEVQQALKDMKLVVEKVKKSGGLRSLLDSEAYIAFANEIVDITEAAHGIISQPEASPHKYAIQVGKKRVAVIKTLENTSRELDASCQAVLNSLRPLCQNSATYSKLADTLNTYKTHVQNSINAFINQLFDTAAMINKGQLEKILPILNNLEVVIFAHKCLLLEENKFLEETLDMIRGVHEWKQSLLPTTTEPSNTSISRTMAQHNSTANNELSFYPNPCLSSTMFEQQTQSCFNTTSSFKSTLPTATSKRELYPDAYFEEVINSLSRDGILFYNIVDKLESDRSILCGTSGIQFLCESDRSQLQALSQRTMLKKASLKKLIRTHEALIKDSRYQTRTHFKRILVPLYILDRQKYEETMRSIGVVVNIFL